MRKVISITGARVGIGRATVAEFARAGCDVALLSRDPGRLEDAAREVRACGVRALAIPIDVADAEAVEAAATRIEDELGPIDICTRAMTYSRSVGRNRGDETTRQVTDDECRRHASRDSSPRRNGAR